MSALAQLHEEEQRLQMQYDQFKLDAAAIVDNRQPQNRIVVYNFNVPLRLSQDVSAFERIRQQVETDFPANAQGSVIPPYYQITAVYTLVHRATGEQRLWVGSFNARARNVSQVTAFRPLDHATFVQYALTNCQLERVQNRLTAVVTGKDSVWTLEEVKSLVVSVQSTVRLNHSVFLRHPELNHDAPGRQRQILRIIFD